MKLNELYAKYGELLVKQEILQNQVAQVKAEIAKYLNEKEPVKPEELKKEEK